jgi:hypothetical protein
LQIVPAVIHRFFAEKFVVNFVELCQDPAPVSERGPAPGFVNFQRDIARRLTLGLRIPAELYIPSARKFDGTARVTHVLTALR